MTQWWGRGGWTACTSHWFLSSPSPLACCTFCGTVYESLRWPCPADISVSSAGTHHTFWNRFKHIPNASTDSEWHTLVHTFWNSKVQSDTFTYCQHWQWVKYTSPYILKQQGSDTFISAALTLVTMGDTAMHHSETARFDHIHLFASTGTESVICHTFWKLDALTD